ncbi:MAG: hypothetical protein Q8K60_03840 [Parachlamydiaceae bacterium]|nr:hypothetical protein [Parachlamydiaceae bacterium]
MTPQPTLIKRSTLSPPYQASKWQSYQVLLDIDEMKNLIQYLGDFWIIQTSGVISIGKEIISKNHFLEVYSEYINDLKHGQLPNDALFLSYFSSIWTNTINALYTFPINSEQCLVKVETPVIQLQNHRFDFFESDQKFRSTLGLNAIYWGIQFSFPNLFQNEKLEIFKVRDENIFPNVSLFKTMQKWMRASTIPTRFETNCGIFNAPIRIGKQCKWINTHPQLYSKGLKVI